MNHRTLKAIWAAIGSSSPEPEPCPTCQCEPIVTIYRDEDGYIGRIECSPESRRIRGILKSGAHEHADFSGPCATPEDAYDAVVGTWNGHLSGLLPRGKRFPIEDVP
jgi:hypothetical protein